MFAKALVLVVMIALAVGFAARSSHGAGPERRIVVRPGDTLWTIATRTYPGDVREGVWRLEQRNGLQSATIVPGQQLVVPAG
jgi:LysM repeat protein